MGLEKSLIKFEDKLCEYYKSWMTFLRILINTLKKVCNFYPINTKHVQYKLCYWYGIPSRFTKEDYITILIKTVAMIFPKTNAMLYSFLKLHKYTIDPKDPIFYLKKAQSIII